MSRFCTLFSSSSGNSTLIGCSSGGILVDAGKNSKNLCAALANVSVAPDYIKAIFVTHEHADHIGALRVFATKFRIPVYASEGTMMSLVKSECVTSKMKSDIIPDGGIEICGMFVKSYRTSHDSIESCGYCVNMPDGRKISVATDTGIVTQDMVDNVTGSDLILLESNYDEEMLKNGPYPYPLKKRIASDTGHLSNTECARAAEYFVRTGTSRLVLGHLSRENNIPALAYQITNEALGAAGAVEGTDYILHVAPPDTCERMIVL